MFFQENIKKILKNPVAFFFVFAFWFLGGCREPLFLSSQSEKESSQTEASRGTVSRRKKDEIVQINASPPRQLKAVSLDPDPLREPFVLKTTDLGSTFPRGEKMAFAASLDELNPVIRNKTSFIEKLEEPSYLMTESEKATFTIQSEKLFYREKEGVSFTEQPGELSFRGMERVSFTGQPGEPSFRGVEGVSFTEPLERQFLEEETEVFFTTEPLEKQFSTGGEEVFFIEPLEERPFLESEVNSALQMVFFDHDSSTLSEEAQIGLDANIKWLKAYPHINHVILIGHGDSLGSENYNNNLGLKRAESVKEYLKFHGIPEDMFVLVSHGETQPLSDTNTDLNRRVSFAPIE